MIPLEYIEKYKEIYREEYGKEISNQKALDELTALVCLMSAVERHINSPRYKEINED